MSNTHVSAEVDNACSAARQQVIVALGLAKRAKADLETVRDTTGRVSQPHKSVSGAWGLMCYVVDRLTAAEYELRAFAQPSGPARACDLTQGLGDRVRKASQAVRGAVLAEGSSSVTWLAEADGALSQDLVAAMDAATLMVQRLPDLVATDEEQASSGSR